MKKFILIVVFVLMLGAGAFFFRNEIFPGISGGALVIATNTEETDISPYGINLNNLTRIRNIYEGLVAFDRNLKIIPSLAVSWGNLSDTLWEFRLREGVFFHDGSLMTAQDVVDVFNKAKSSANSQINDYVSTIKDIRIADNNRLLIETTLPDPLLLSKLTKVFVYRDDHIGTGPYRLNEWIPKERFSIRVFDRYWGETPPHEKVHYDVIRNRTEREGKFERGEIDLLVGLTPEQALNLPSSQVLESYGLEVNFLMFQLNNPLFKDRKIREAVRSLIDPVQIESIGNNFVKSTNQFIAEGVLGYNQTLPYYVYDSEKEARDIFGNRLERLNFDYLNSYQTLGEYLITQLRKAGFSVKENVNDSGELLKKIQANESPLFLVGWQAEDGDGGGFFEAFVHSEGTFNNGRYKNTYVDRLIEESRNEMNPQRRLLLLQEIGKRVYDDFIGIPLFETSRLYAIKKGTAWTPRLDGQVLASEVR